MFFEKIINFFIFLNLALVMYFQWKLVFLTPFKMVDPITNGANSCAKNITKSPCIQLKRLLRYLSAYYIWALRKEKHVVLIIMLIEGRKDWFNLWLTDSISARTFPPIYWDPDFTLNRYKILLNLHCCIRLTVSKLLLK